jgi:hypothetical protein
MANYTFGASLAVNVLATTDIARRGLALRTVAISPAQDSDVATRNYLTTVRGSFSLSPTQITTLISTGLSPYATKTYVNTRDALNASQAQVDAGDASRLKITAIDANNGVAGLDSGGRVPVARVPGASTQRWPKSFYTPSVYGTATSASGTETTVYTQSIADPGFPYRLLISGHLDCRTATDGDAPQVRVRVGSATGTVVATGTAQSNQFRYGVENFNRTAPSLGAGWEQNHTGGGDGHAETTTKAFWVPVGLDASRKGVYRKISDFSATVDDYQEIYYRVVDPIGTTNFLGEPPHNRIFGRMNNARNSYIAFDMTDTDAKLIYAAGGAEAALASVNDFNQNSGDEILAQFGYYSAVNKRRFRLLRNGIVKIDYVDTANATVMGGDNRGWGFGLQAGTPSLFYYPPPASLDWIALTDPVAPWGSDPENYSPAVITSTALSTQTNLSGAQVLYVTLRATSSATVYATSVQPKLYVVAIPA